MATSMTGLPSAKSQESLVQYTANALMFLNNNFNIRAQLLERDRAYAREQDFTEKQQRLQTQNRQGRQVAENVTIPIVMPQVESGLAFLTDKFLTGYPLFPTISKPILSDAALQIETLIGDHSARFGWVPELMMTLRDGLKYNIGAMEVEWQTKKIASVVNDTSSASSIDKGKVVETYSQGNVFKHLSMYNVIMDTRIANPSRMHIDGEFAGYTELLGKIQLKQKIADLGAESTMNAKAAFESGTGTYSSTANTANFFVPEVNPAALVNQNNSPGNDFNWLVWGGFERNDSIKYSGTYEVTTLYCRILPGEHDLTGPQPKTPQIWKLIVVNRQVLIFAERQTNAHNYLGILFVVPLEDGLGWQTKSFGDNVTGLQQAASSLYNSGLESQRKKVYDRMLYDPSRINKADIENTSPVARIPVKQQAYGSNLSDAIYQAPYRDDGVAQIFGVARDVVEISNVVNGQNRVSQGQFQKGNKTRGEFDEVMGNSDARMFMMALCLEYRFFQPLKEIVKLNILQFQPPANLFNRTTQQPVKIDPSVIRQASIEFRMADGLLPVDKMMSPESFQLVMQMSQGNPQFAAGYDVLGAFFHYLQLKGASWLIDFKRTPEQQKQYLDNQQALNGAQTSVTDANGNAITGPAPTGPLQ